eukprot:541705-Pelagomonas_calceolata.AAC.1
MASNAYRNGNDLIHLILEIASNGDYPLPPSRPEPLFVNRRNEARRTRPAGAPPSLAPVLAFQ